jgi:hypothetical protein
MAHHRQSKGTMGTTPTVVSAAAALFHRNNRIMRIALAATVFSFVTFLIILTSSDWVTLAYPNDFFSIKRKMYVEQITYGIIWECVFGRRTKDSAYGK